MDLTKIFVVVEKVFELCFSDLCYEIILDGKIIVIKINNVNPHYVFNPMDFEPSHKMFCKDDKTILTLSKYDFFYPLYSYIPDYTPYIEIHYYPYPLSIQTIDLNKPFRVHSLKPYYDNMERQIKVPNALYQNIYDI